MTEQEKKKKVTPPVPERMRKFVAAYMETGNATEAARRAGYGNGTDSACAVAGSELLRKPKVKELIEKAQQKLESKSIASREERLQILSELVRGNLEARPGERIRAADLISKMNGEQIINNRISGPTGGPVEIEALGLMELIKLLKEDK